MKPLSILLAGLTICVATHSAHAKVQLKKSGTKVDITVDGEAFAVFNFGKDLPKPFMSPVRGPGGAVLTREIFMEKGKGDHPHHKGIWLSLIHI